MKAHCQPMACVAIAAAESTPYQSSTPLTADDDDGIVVGRSCPEEETAVVPNRLPPELRERLGDEAALGLLELLESERAEWSERVLSVAADWFERRLAEQIAGVRVELSAVRADIVRELDEGLGSIRQELATVRVDTRQELANARVETLRWSVLFWVGQVAAMAGLLALMFRLTGR